MSEKMETNTTVIKASDVETTLDELAGIIRAEIQNCRTALANALAAAMDAGDALLEVQPMVRAAGRTWHRWLEHNCFIAVSTAKLYMQLASHRAEIEAAIRSDPELSLRAARRLISRPKRTINDADSAAEEESLFDHWLRLTPEVLAAELDRIGVDRVLGVMSPAFGRELRDRVPTKTTSADGKGKAPGKTTETTHTQLDRGALARGTGLAGLPGNKFRTITMTQNGSDADGNPNYGQPPADRSRAN
jgi:hypothetical protein